MRASSSHEGGVDRRSAPPAGLARPATSWMEAAARALALVASASSGAVLFAVSEAGYASLSGLALRFALPGFAALVLLALVAGPADWHGLRTTLLWGAVVGLAATAGLEAVRIVGFRVFHAMPGSMPMLMGVLLSDRIMLGPDALSNLLGWLDHVYNGVAFVLIYLLAVGRWRPWTALPYALAIGTGFLVSPVPRALGAGFFGAAMGPKFAITVYLAHLMFGLILLAGLRRAPDLGRPLLSFLGENREHSA